MDNKYLHCISDREKAGPSVSGCDYAKCEMQNGSQNADMISQSIQNKDETEEIQSRDSVSVRYRKRSKSLPIDLHLKSYKQNQEIRNDDIPTPTRMSSNGMKLMTQESLTNQNTNPTHEEELSDEICRICYESNLRNEFISPCRCTGSIGVVHKSCLETWIKVSHWKICGICKATFPVEVTETTISFLEFLFSEQSRGLFLMVFIDLILLVLLIIFVFCFIILLRSFFVQIADLRASISIPGVSEKENFASILNSFFQCALRGKRKRLLRFLTPLWTLMYLILLLFPSVPIYLILEFDIRLYNSSWEAFKKRNGLKVIFKNV